MEATGRFFLCSGCRAQVVICSACDRGQRYCAGGCGKAAREHAVREAGRRYQNSRRGRFNHAARNRRYRARQRNVTHQGSPAPAADDLLLVTSTTQEGAAAPAPATVHAAWRCHFCSRPCPAWVRIDPLRRRVPHPNRRGTDLDHSP